MAKDRESSKENNFATKDNITNEFDFAVKIILSKGGKFATGHKFFKEGNFATRASLPKRAKEPRPVSLPTVASLPICRLIHMVVCLPVGWSGDLPGGIHYMWANTSYPGNKIPRHPVGPRQLPAPLFNSAGACGTRHRLTNLPGCASLALHHH